MAFSDQWGHGTPWAIRAKQRRAEWLEVKRIAEAVLAGTLPDTAGRTLAMEWLRGEAGRVVRPGSETQQEGE